MQHISAREFAEWMAYARLESFGDVREDRRVALLAAVIAAGAGMKGKDDKSLDPSDFYELLVPIIAEPEDEEGGAEDGMPDDAIYQAQIRVAEMITGAFGGVDLRGK